MGRVDRASRRLTLSNRAVHQALLEPVQPEACDRDGSFSFLFGGLNTREGEE